MGTDDFHRTRKTKTRDREAKRKENEIILIVCEGEKTEKNYLNQLKDFFELTNVSMNIISSKDSDPFKIVNFAEKKSKENAYDKIYCVFDKDKHSSFNKAKQKCDQCNFEAIVSIPCFEFWVLLHFTYTTKPFGTTNSPCDELINTCLKEYIKNYTKNYDFTSIIQQNLNAAIANAQKANKEAEKNNYTSSYTFMDKLALKFQELNSARINQ
ncbi:RloB domain-containing protein [Campylobacter lari]|nr:RloB domain-containing protein [Campylobacter lari]